MRTTIAVLFCVLIFACSQKKSVKIPDDILTEEKMADVMVDIHLVEASMNLNVINPEKVSGGQTSPNFDVLRKHSITKKKYDASFDFYTHHPDLLSEVYQLVLNDLSKMQAEVMNKK